MPTRVYVTPKETKKENVCLCASVCMCACASPQSRMRKLGNAKRERRAAMTNKMESGAGVGARARAEHAGSSHNNNMFDRDVVVVARLPANRGVGMLMGEGGRLISSERINVHIARWRLCKFT